MTVVSFIGWLVVFPQTQKWQETKMSDWSLSGYGNCMDRPKPLEVIALLLDVPAPQLSRLHLCQPLLPGRQQSKW